jgi:hypothetical protein
LIRALRIRAELGDIREAFLNTFIEAGRARTGS